MAGKRVFWIVNMGSAWPQWQVRADLHSPDWQSNMPLLLADLILLHPVSSIEVDLKMMPQSSS